MTPLPTELESFTIVVAAVVVIVVIGILAVTVRRNLSRRPTINLEADMVNHAKRILGEPHSLDTIQAMNTLEKNIRPALSRLRSYEVAWYVGIQSAMLVVSVFDRKGKGREQRLVNEIASLVRETVIEHGKETKMNINVLGQMYYPSPFMGVSIYGALPSVASPNPGTIPTPRDDRRNNTPPNARDVASSDRYRNNTLRPGNVSSPGKGASSDWYRNDTPDWYRNDTPDWYRNNTPNAENDEGSRDRRSSPPDGDDARRRTSQDDSDLFGALFGNLNKR